MVFKTIFVNRSWRSGRSAISRGRFKGQVLKSPEARLGFIKNRFRQIKRDLSNRLLTMNNFPFGITNLGNIHILNKTRDFIKSRVYIALVISNHTKTNSGTLQHIVIANLSYGNIEFVFCSINEFSEDLSLPFQGIIAVDSEINSANSNYHNLFLENYSNFGATSS